MDAAYVHALNKKESKTTESVDTIDVEEIGLTPELFDALFIAGSNDNALLRKEPDG
jgi:hypothetical protein